MKLTRRKLRKIILEAMGYSDHKTFPSSKQERMKIYRERVLPPRDGSIVINGQGLDGGDMQTLMGIVGDFHPRFYENEGLIFTNIGPEMIDDIRIRGMGSRSNVVTGPTGAMEYLVGNRFDKPGLFDRFKSL